MDGIEIKDKGQIEIDFVKILKLIWSKRNFLFKTVFCFFLLGVIFILGTPKVYKSETTLLLESPSGLSGMGGLLQQFGGLAGISLGSTSGADLNPQIYPDIVKSSPFLKDLLSQRVKESKYDSTLLIAEYLERYSKPSLTGIILGYTIGLPGKIIGWIRGKGTNISKVSINENDSIFILSKKEMELHEALSGIIKIKQNKTDNKLIISVECQDPFVAAQILKHSITKLTLYVSEYRTQKSKNDFEFISKRQKEAFLKYETAQSLLAVHRDKNKNVILASSKSQEDRLQAEYNLAFNVYNTLSQQLEQARIKVQQEMPVFTVLNPAYVPLIKSKPQTILIIIVFCFLGVLSGVLIIFWKSRFN